MLSTPTPTKRQTCICPNPPQPIRICPVILNPSQPICICAIEVRLSVSDLSSWSLPSYSASVVGKPPYTWWQRLARWWHCPQKTIYRRRHAAGQPDRAWNRSHHLQQTFKSNASFGINYGWSSNICRLTGGQNMYMSDVCWQWVSGSVIHKPITTRHMMHMHAQSITFRYPELARVRVQVDRPSLVCLLQVIEDSRCPISHCSSVHLRRNSAVL